MRTFNRFLLGIALVCIAAPAAHASMRCGSSMINEGQSTAEVLQTCGKPESREVTPPSSAYGGGVTVEHWIYGPKNGVYRYLRFIEDKLVEIRSERG